MLRNTNAAGPPAPYLAERLESRRLLAGIALDLTYGVDGHAVTDLSVTGLTEEYVGDAVLDHDGRVVTIGQTIPSPGSSSNDLTLTRLTGDGTRDASFGVDGIVRFRDAAPTTGRALALLPDGRLLAAGFASGTESRPRLLRYFSNGRLDRSFGNSGVATLGTGMIVALLALPNGKVLASGRNAGDFQTGISAFWRFNADGSPDSTFGVGGMRTFDQNTPFQNVGRLTLLSDGKFLASTSRGIARFNSDGSQDLTFGLNGHLAPDGVSGGYARQQDGRIVILCQVQAVASPGYDWEVVRYFEDGQIDPSFGVDGSVVFDIANDTHPSSVIIQPNGMILAAGSTFDSETYDNFTIVRVLPNGVADSSFGARGILVDPFASSFGDDELIRLLPLPNNVLYAVGTSDVSPPGTTTSRENVAAARYVLDVPLNIDLGGPYASLPEGGSVAVSAIKSSYANGTISSFEWAADYKPGYFRTTATGVKAALDATDSPTLNVALRVTTSDGLQAISSIAIDVTNVAPTVQMAPERFVAFATPSTVFGSITDPGQEQFTLTFDYGDGSTPTTLNTSLRTFSATHTYANRGVYTLSVSVSDDDGAATTVTSTVNSVSLAGRAFQDSNDNETIDPNIDIPFAKRITFLDADGDGQLDDNEATSTTDAAGDFAFDELAPGPYRVVIIEPQGWRRTLPVSGNFIDANVTATLGASCDFAFTQRARVSGFVFNDGNGNGIREGAEGAFTGLNIYVDINNDGVRQTNEPVGGTISTGFQIRNVPAGTHVIRLELQSSRAQTLPGVGQGRSATVAAAEVVTVPDFGVCTGARVTGIVFEDRNRNGVRDVGEEIFIVPTFADINNNGSFDIGEPKNSSISGTYNVGSLPPGTYNIRMNSTGLGIVQSFPANGQPHVVTLALGQTASGRNFGFYQDDSVLPVITSSAFLKDTFAHVLRVGFSESVVLSAPASLLSLNNLSTGEMVDPAFVEVYYNHLTRTASFTFPGFADGILPDGRYRATVLASGVLDAAWNQMAANAEIDFFVLAGDANHSGNVNVNDFTILAANFGQVNRTFSQGDFNYDGVVNVNDFTILASRFNTMLGPDGSIQRTGERLSAPKSPFGSSAIADTGTEDDRLRGIVA